MKKVTNLSLLASSILLVSASGAVANEYQMEARQSNEAFNSYGYTQTQDIEDLKQEIKDQHDGEMVYSTMDEVMEVLSGGMKTLPNGTERWKEGLLFDGIEPMPWLKSSANWFPNTEEVQPNEMRVTFMGTSPNLRPGQMNTSIYVELGNGDNFIFDIGEGSMSNYMGANIALNQLDKVFITHLHVDHYGSLPWLYQFGGWAGRWEKPLTVYGPSGAKPEYGTRHMVEGMLQMLTWHSTAFDVFPSGNDINVVEFDYKDDGGIIYDVDGVTVKHWRRSHAMDGASAYRLDWQINEEESMCFVWTGDGRPTDLDIKYAEGCDLFVTELQTEVLGVNAMVQGVPPFLFRYTVDTHHTPAYAAGYLANEVQPRLFMTTHMQYDPYINPETQAQIREHWKGPFHFGAPDMVVVNMTPDQAWVREGVLSEYPNNRAPQMDLGPDAELRIPVPKYQRKDLQQQEIRDAEVDPSLYYPEGYHPELITEWPTDKDVIIPAKQLPISDDAVSGEQQRHINKNREALGLDEPRSINRFNDAGDWDSNSSTNN